MGPRLMKEATINAKEAGERGISAKSVKKATEASHARLLIRSLLANPCSADVPPEV